MAAPRDAPKLREAFQSVLPNVRRMKVFKEFADMLGEVAFATRSLPPRLTARTDALWQGCIWPRPSSACTGTPWRPGCRQPPAWPGFSTLHCVSTAERCAKRSVPATLLSLPLQMYCPAVQNDFSFYRRSLAKLSDIEAPCVRGDGPRSLARVADATTRHRVRDRTADDLSMFLASQTPVLDAVERAILAAGEDARTVRARSPGVLAPRLPVSHTHSHPPGRVRGASRHCPRVLCDADAAKVEFTPRSPVACPRGAKFTHLATHPRQRGQHGTRGVRPLHGRLPGVGG